MVYIDFLPNQTGDYVGQYEPFQSLIDRANNWLQRNTNMEVITCETITIRADAPGMPFNGELMICPCFTVQNTAGNHRFDKEPELHALRLWYLGHEDIDPETSAKHDNNNDKKAVANKESSETATDSGYEPQRIGYTTLVPSLGVGTETEVNGYLSSAKKVYEPIAATISRHNEELGEDPLRGHILNVQTIRVSYYDDDGPADPEQTYQSPGETEMQVVRIYYSHGKNLTLKERIGFADFMPTQTGNETFTDMFGMVDDWIHRQNNMRVCHIQTIFCNKQDDQKQYVDTQKPLVKIAFGMELIRAIRVWYLRPHPDEKIRFPRMPALGFRTFEPIMKRIEEEYYIIKDVTTNKGKTKKKKTKRIRVEVLPMESMLVTSKKAVAELKDKRIGILGVETDLAYVNDEGVGTCETMKIKTDLKLKRSLRFYTFDVPKGVILPPSGGRKSESTTSEACQIL